MTAIQSPGIGHNSRDELEELLLEQRHTELRERRDTLHNGVECALEHEIDGPESAGKLGDFIKQLGLFVKDAEEARKAEKKPYLDGCRQVDAYFGDLTSPIESGIRALKEVQAAWMKANGVTSKLRGDYGSVSTLRTKETVIGFERNRLDWRALGLYINDVAVMCALEQALKCGDKIDGARYGDKDTITTR